MEQYAGILECPGYLHGGIFRSSFHQVKDPAAQGKPVFYRQQNGAKRCLLNMVFTGRLETGVHFAVALIHSNLRIGGAFWL